MLMFGLILMIASTSLLNLVDEKKRFSDRQEAYQLARNLTETLLAMPLDEAKAIDPDTRKGWTANHRYVIETRWEPYASNAQFEKLTVEYLKDKQSLIHLSVLHSKK
jgi:hypothetical protein